MAQKTRAQLSTELNSVITDPLNRQNTAARVRQILQDIIDSQENIIDDASTELSAADNGLSITGGTSGGTIELGGSLIKDTNIDMLGNQLNIYNSNTGWELLKRTNERYMVIGGLGNNTWADNNQPTSQILFGGQNNINSTFGAAGAVVLFGSVHDVSGNSSDIWLLGDYGNVVNSFIVNSFGRGNNYSGANQVTVVGNANTVNTSSNLTVLGQNSTISDSDKIYIANGDHYVVFDASGNTGYGTIVPQESIHISGGTIRINTVNGTEGAGKLAVSDANGSISFSSLTSLNLVAFLPLSGGTLTGDLVMNSGTTINTNYGGGQINLAYGIPDNVLIGNDSGAYMNEQLYLSPNYWEVSTYSGGNTAAIYALNSAGSNQDRQFLLHYVSDTNSPVLTPDYNTIELYAAQSGNSNNLELNTNEVKITKRINFDNHSYASSKAALWQNINTGLGYYLGINSDSSSIDNLSGGSYLWFANNEYAELRTVGAASQKETRVQVGDSGLDLSSYDNTTGYHTGMVFQDAFYVGINGTDPLWNGAIYLTDPQSNFVGMSLVHKQYVDQQVTGNTVGLIAGSGTTGYMPVWNSSGTLGTSILQQNAVTGLTVYGSVEIYGNVDIAGTATTFNTQSVSTKDNNISMNLSGSHVSALYGGITILSGTPNNGNSTWTIDSNGAWSANTAVFTSAITVNGGAIVSGSTNLYSIFKDINSSTGIAAGTNIITGGTYSAPVISTVNSPSFNQLNISGETWIRSTLIITGTTTASTIVNGSQAIGSETVNLTGQTILSGLTVSSLPNSSIPISSSGKLINSNSLTWSIANNILNVGQSTDTGYMALGGAARVNAASRLSIIPNNGQTAALIELQDGSGNLDFTFGRGASSTGFQIGSNAVSFTSFVIPKGSGNIGIGGVAAPSAFTHINSATTTNASLRLAPGYSQVANPGSGDMWNDQNYLNIGVVGLSVTGNSRFSGVTASTLSAVTLSASTHIKTPQIQSTAAVQILNGSSAQNLSVGAIECTSTSYGSNMPSAGIIYVSSGIATNGSNGVQILNGGSAQMISAQGAFLGASYGTSVVAGQVIQSRNSSEGNFITLRNAGNDRLQIGTLTTGAHAQIASQNGVDLRMGVVVSSANVDFLRIAGSTNGNTGALSNGTQAFIGSERVNFSGTSQLSAITVGSATTYVAASSDIRISNAGNSSISLTSTDVTSGEALFFGHTNSTVHRFNLTNNNTGVTGNYAGTSIPQSATTWFNKNNSLGQNGLGGMVFQGSPIHNIPGQTGTNLGTRLDATGLAVDLIQNLHNANTFAFSVNGTSSLSSVTASTFVLTQQQNATANSAQTVNCSIYNNFSYVLSANTTFTFSNMVNGQTIVMDVTQASNNSGLTSTFTAGTTTIKWQGGNTPTQTATSGKTDVYTFIQSNNIIYGVVSPNF
jgi:hypothetical protein